MATFPSIRIEGGLLGPDLLDQLLAGQLTGQRAIDFGLDGKRNLTDEIASAFAHTRTLWDMFQHRLARLPEADLATSATRDAWMIPFLGLLGYELKYNQRGYDVDGLTFAISHRAGEPEDSSPIHIVGARQELGRVPASGRPRLAPHSLVQEYLNRSDSVWGVVTNGFTLRLLRDTTFVRRQAYVEFDLQGMIEEKRFEDFAALYRLLHRTRLPQGHDDADQCLLEKYYSHSIEQGGRVRDHLRDGVEITLTKLANGFLSHPANESLRRRVSPECLGNDRITAEHFYQQVLRLVYRFLFLLVAEDRGLLGSQELYRNNYGVGRLRKLVDTRGAYTHHDDIWRSLRVLWRVLIDDMPRPQLEGKPFASALGLTVLNGDLFAPVDLDDCSLSNRDLLDAFWSLVWYDDRESKVKRRVNYAALDVEELGSVYESLIEFHPSIQTEGIGFHFALLPGTERKSTGSYYTPPELVNELIQSALDPVMRDRLQANPKEKEKAILSIRVCDPACGSGHFLLAAARHLGKELARVRTGEDEPAPERVREAIRDVISHCIYGVDKNPLAVDLCRVALWIESYTEEKPLTFLDHRVRCGDSLVGVFDLSCLNDGIPDKAFEAVEGDNRAVARAALNANCHDRAGQFKLPLEPEASLHQLTAKTREIDQIADDSPDHIRRKKSLFERSHQNEEWLRDTKACDLWTAAFFQNFDSENPPITSSAVIDVLSRRSIDGRIQGKAQALSERLNFFHWPLQFPEVFEGGGFDSVVSNPPWERIKLQEQEFFATRDPNIARALNKSVRRELIEALRESNPELGEHFRKAKHAIAAQGKFVRQSQRFVLSAVGDINTYALFAELARHLTKRQGYAGLILPTGIATDDTLKEFFSDLMRSGTLVRLIGFENEEFIFSAVANVVRFCVFVIAGQANRSNLPEFAFYIRRFNQLSERVRFFELSRADLELLNPNTLTSPVFRTRTDADLSRAIYKRIPILENKRTNAHSWGVQFLRMFDMANDSDLFSNKPGNGYAPLYEAKMFWQFDHRFASYEFKGIVAGKGGRGLPEMPLENHRDPNYNAQPRYWVTEVQVEARTPEYWTRQWFLAFRDVTSAKLERTAVFTVLPKLGVGHKAPLILLEDEISTTLIACLVANFNAIVFDYCTRQKLGGTSLSYFVLKQLPVLSASAYTPADIDFIYPRVLELVYTSYDVAPFAADCGYEGEPFEWDEDRRALLRAELDAYYAKLYGLTRDELRYILDPKEVYGQDFPSETFRVLKEKELRQFGEYRTRRLVLEAWDRFFAG